MSQLIDSTFMLGIALLVGNLTSAKVLQEFQNIMSAIVQYSIYTDQNLFQSLTETSENYFGNVLLTLKSKEVLTSKFLHFRK